ncbi:predicted protein [Sclerotinia sclerotiorum 1980 UF-70]|uniref:Uncharacterized protein n=1 Tax=Sclerotinia sclerotiorum (strain ATCC 18683 / 1980 / Ss-1) TaxID=665079 RepID=A7F101_SCLS1|nr:predicted protein [Sclerotinia sclerotiorum 1980 UF-70]EDN95393.1 predicted protein [Sclerotinia sclerotiorum 1980 UF-70]
MSDITMNEIVSATGYVHRRTLRLTVSIIRDYEVCKMVDRLLLHLHDKTIHEEDSLIHRLDFSLQETSTPRLISPEGLFE